MKRKLYIIGAGTGSKELLTEKGLRLIKTCDVVYSSAKRLLQQFSEIRGDIIDCPFSEMQSRIMNSEGEKIAVLVSGDTGFFSIAKQLPEKLAGTFDIELVCGISSMQYLCSKTGADYENLKVVSLHGREKSILAAVSYNRRVFVLTGGSNKAETVCRTLTDSGLGAVGVTAGENLSMPGERIIKADAKEISGYSFDDLTVLLIENDDFVNPYQPLHDENFIRGDIPMTKEEVRSVTLAKLAIEPCDIVYDIGAGTGSVAVEMARRAYDGQVFAIEQKKEGTVLINQNRCKLGAYNLSVIHGKAPDALLNLPRPDKAFIGGSSGNMDEIVRLLAEKNPTIRLAANAITLETLNEAVDVFEKHGFKTDIVCINISSSKRVGGYHMMMANNPVYVISGEVRGGR